MRERFASGLSDDSAKVSIETLNKNLSLVIDLSLTVKQAHWTMRGNGFIGVHELLDDAVANLRDILDKIAERTVVLGGTPVGISQVVAEETALPRYPTDTVSVKDHVRELTERYKLVAASLREAIDTTDDGGDQDTSDLFTEASRIVDKDAWFIGSNADGN
ncbi:DNA starvation/stationary phase protection protein Dps [Falsirhodobacter algicola]|uniref:DNA starvation/stationary phase protection protein Dps n=1 Tax=Falsirhodobacter algicola TaxID=2692330 RepID=A0A8J8MRZ7_9RHOB|nr:DNA starvation/stationary phase protection protein Dps [Falsirhodobacter algicola]QUS35645.1 DNA starvation/stationary phase protection protein Dps [Falsirhodobacter algicola]